MPPPAHAELVCAMEDGREVYTRPYEHRRPQVGLDETSNPLVADTREPIPATRGQPVRIDDAYARKGTAHLCMVFEPVAGPRRVKVTERRTAIDVAPVMRELVDEPYPHAETMVMVMDHLHTHKPASLDEACAPTAAWRLRERLEIPDTPTHGSWVEMAETELSL